MDTNEKENIVEEEVKVEETTTPVVEESATKEPVKEETTETKTDASIETATNIFGLPEEKVEKVEEPKVEEAKEEVKEETTPVTPEPEIQAEKSGEENILYEYKKEKEMGPLPVVIFFVFIGLIIAFLPSIQKYIKDYQNGKITITGVKKEIEEPTQNPTTQETPEEEKYYDFNNEATVSINRLTLTKFDKKTEGINYFVTFNVANKDNKEYPFDENIYIELYNSNKMLLSRSLLETDKNLAGSSSMEVSLPIDEKAFSQVSLMMIKQIDKNTYPSITIAENLQDQQVYVCRLANRNTTYTFKNDKLLSIDDQIVKERTDYLDMESYQEDYLAYKQLANSNNTIAGLSASVLDENNQFSYAVKIDLSSITEADLKGLNVRNYYSKDTEARVIAFEMSARGYSCETGK